MEKTIPNRIDSNSSKNQAIKGRFVSQTIHCCVTSEVEYILANPGPDAPIEWADVENESAATMDEMQEFIRLHLDEEEEQEARDELEVDSLEEADREGLQDYLEAHHRFEAEPAEILEWWKVDGFLVRELQEEGEPVIVHANLWGRTCSGQAILLDGVISRICEEMEILEGQANEWEA